MAPHPDHASEPDRQADLVSAVLVDHNSGQLLVDCVSSLENEGLSQIVIVDNASRQGSVENITGSFKNITASSPKVRLVKPGHNLGYGAGANRGAATCTTEFVLIANPDLLVHSGAVAAMLEVLQGDPTLAAVGPKTLRPDGTRYPSARRFPRALDAIGHAVLARLVPENPFSKRYRLDELPTDRVSGVDWVSGSCMVVRVSAFEEVGGFDEAYFMYAEDMDLCWRLRRAGWQIAFVPEAVVTHQQGQSTSSHPYKMLAAHHLSAMRFEARTSTGWRKALFPAVVIFLAFRLVGSIFASFAKTGFRIPLRARLG